MTTPTCPACGTKFPGDPCKKCARTTTEAIDHVHVRTIMAKAKRRATKKVRKHGRPR